VPSASDLVEMVELLRGYTDMAWIDLKSAEKGMKGRMAWRQGTYSGGRWRRHREIPRGRAEEREINKEESSWQS